MWRGPVGEGAKRTRTGIAEVYFSAKVLIKAEGRGQKAKISLKILRKKKEKFLSGIISASILNIQIFK